MTQRDRLINIVTSNDKFKKTCMSINPRYADDIFQNVCEQILTMAEHRLPSEQHLSFWFFCVAKNNISRTGELGKILRDNPTDSDLVPVSYQNETTDKGFKKVENWMLSLTEFDNRVVLLFNQLGNMKEVQRVTGISYSALRSVKEKMKQLK